MTYVIFFISHTYANGDGYDGGAEKKMNWELKPTPITRKTAAIQVSCANLPTLKPYLTVLPGARGPQPGDAGISFTTTARQVASLHGRCAAAKLAVMLSVDTAIRKQRVQLEPP